MIWHLKHTMLHMLNQPNGYAVMNMRGSRSELKRRKSPSNVSEALHQCSADAVPEALQ
ncbi:hypothetical protein [Gardnerella vaginalis]|uniref:hypothetical protein n=1 Tax=Gardnerella TaxID=2701 RepID=UPI0035C73642